jgi:predicted ABC-type ATPase
MERPKLLIIAGPNGAGKTSVTSQILKHEWVEGEYINPDYKSIANCILLSQIVDRLYVYDNSVENGLTELLFRANEGKLVKQYAPMHEWTKLIYENCNKMGGV